MILSIEDYDRAEYEATATACYPALRAFCPIYFLNHGVPTNVTREIELMRYVDMMGEVNAFSGWDKARFSETEIQEIYHLKSIVEEATLKLFDRRITPVSNLLSPWPILRVVRHISMKLGRKLDIFEGAAGCGYLGAYLIGDGHQYTGFDITQGLYLWQNRLWSSLADVWEIGINNDVNEYGVVHEPWWYLSKFHERAADPQSENYDIVICDSALGEMGWFGYKYFINAARRMLDQSEVGCLLMTSVGDPKNQQTKQVHTDLIALGFKLHRCNGVEVWTTERFPHKIMNDMKPPTGRKLSEFFHAPDPLPDNYAFMRFAGLA